VKKFALALLAACATVFVIFQVSVQVSAQEQPGISPADVAQAKSDFNATCAACHGEDAGGGDRAPSLIGNAHLRVLPGAGHMSPITHPVEITALVAEHIEENRRSSTDGYRRNLNRASMG